MDQAPTIEDFYREHARAVYAFCVSLCRDANPEMIGYISDSGAVAESEVQQVAALLETHHQVRSLVITGPSTEIAAFLDAYQQSELSAQVLAIDLYNWTSGICGR